MYAYPRNRTRCIFPAVLLASLISMAPLGCHSFACLSYIFAVRRFLYAPYYEHNNRHVLMVNNYGTLLPSILLYQCVPFLLPSDPRSRFYCLRDLRIFCRNTYLSRHRQKYCSALLGMFLQKLVAAKQQASGIKRLSGGCLPTYLFT